jgi:TrfA protein.
VSASKACVHRESKGVHRESAGEPVRLRAVKAPRDTVFTARAGTWMQASNRRRHAFRLPLPDRVAGSGFARPRLAASSPDSHRCPDHLRTAMPQHRTSPPNRRAPLPVQPTQLPLWHERVRGLPNPIARSSLFTVGNQNEPRSFYREHRTIQTLAGWVLTMRGEELRQDDEDVFLQLMHLARCQPLGEAVSFTAYSFLKELGWKRSVEGYNRLKASFDRLQFTSIRLSSDATSGDTFYLYQGALVRKFMGKSADSDEPRSKWTVWLEPEIIKLFGPSAYTQVWWEQRLRLRSALAKYLHSYFSTHEAPYPLKVETLKGLTGSRAARLTDFRKALRVALQQLVAEGFLDAWTIDGSDIVHVTRSTRGKAAKVLPAA